MTKVTNTKSKAFKKEWKIQVHEHPKVPKKWLKVVVSDHLKIAAKYGKHGG